MAFWNILYSWYWYSVQSLCGSRTAGYRSGYIWVHEHCGTIRANGAQLGLIPTFLGFFLQVWIRSHRLLAAALWLGFWVATYAIYWSTVAS
ncbi:MAG TPA: hypothetical protein VN957_14450 [Chthoniobacterales bacterium]|nr:hypothetical protein [Chthoniobacterales bacterium]